MAIYEKFVSAHKDIRNPYMRTRAEILSIILLLREFLIVLAVPTVLIDKPEMAGAMVGVLFSNFMAYLFSRTRWFGWGAVIIIVESMIMIPMRVFMDHALTPDTQFSPLWLLSGPIISSLVLGKRATALITLTTVLVLLLMMMRVQPIYRDYFMNVILLVLSTSFLTLLGSTLRDNAEKQVEVERSKVINAAKMASLGEMAGGVAHEINNPLAIIKGKTERILRHLEDPYPNFQTIETDIKKVLATSNRIAAIVAGMRTFSRDATHDEFQAQSASQLVNETLALCFEKFKAKDVALRFEVHREVEIKCRTTEISQVLLNLLNNALDAVEKMEVAWVKVELDADEKSVRFSVTDSGAGISKEIQSKIMQPFFTTKEVGKGTGLGLSISRGIAEAHHGTLTIDMTSSNTKFVLELPTDQQAQISAQRAAA